MSTKQVVPDQPSGAEPDQTSGAEPVEPAEGQYRAQALRTLESGPRLNQLLPVTKLRTWLLALAAALIIAATLAYAAVTPRNVTVTGGGRVVGGTGIALVTASAAGQAGAFALEPGTEVKVGQIVAYVLSGGRRIPQRAQTSGTLLGYVPRPGDPLDMGEWIAQISRDIDDGRTALMMVLPEDAGKIREGQPVTLTVIGGPVVTGHVGPEQSPPLSADRVQEGMGVLEPPDGPRVIVELVTDSPAPRGYEFDATILVSERTLLQQLLGGS